MIVYVSIGNSDDKLTQAEWSAYLDIVGKVVCSLTICDPDGHVHGEWYSSPTSQYQSACWCVEFDPAKKVVTRDGDARLLVDWFRFRLSELAAEYRQNSIAWAIAETEFIGPAS